MLISINQTRSRHTARCIVWGKSAGARGAYRVYHTDPPGKGGLHRAPASYPTPTESQAHRVGRRTGMGLPDLLGASGPFRAFAPSTGDSRVSIPLHIGRHASSMVALHIDAAARWRHRATSRTPPPVVTPFPGASRREELRHAAHIRTARHTRCCAVRARWWCFDSVALVHDIPGRATAYSGVTPSGAGGLARSSREYLDE